MFECIKCGAETRMQLLVGVSAPSRLTGKLSKQNLRGKEVWLTHANWETADYICTNTECRHVTDGYGNYVTGLEKKVAQLAAEQEKVRVLRDGMLEIMNMPETFPDLDGYDWFDDAQLIAKNALQATAQEEK